MLVAPESYLTPLTLSANESNEPAPPTQVQDIVSLSDNLLALSVKSNRNSKVPSALLPMLTPLSPVTLPTEPVLTPSTAKAPTQGDLPLNCSSPWAVRVNCTSLPTTLAVSVAKLAVAGAPDCPSNSSKSYVSANAGAAARATEARAVHMATRVKNLFIDTPI